MKILKKLGCLLFILCVLFSFTALVSCGDDTVAEPFVKIVDLAEYVIVIPKEAGTTVSYAAENLALLIKEKVGATLEIVEDDTKETEKEILIGNTNRKESKIEARLEKMQYMLFMENEKIVMQGNGIYIGASCGDFVNKYIEKDADKSSTLINAINVPQKETVLTYTPSASAKSVIFMIGDGMGANHILMAEKNGLDGFAAKEFPFAGESITRSQSVINGEATYTDSAASGTAMATGYKTINGFIGIDKNGQPIPNVRELAAMAGCKTGVITTDVITGATPTSYMCHQGSRNDSEELQAQIDALISQGKIDYCSGDVGDNLTLELKSALALISKNSSFFIMIEEGLIDKASHSRDEEKAIEYVVRFDDAIEYATQFALCNPDVALIVTADHETGKLLEAPGSRFEYGYAFRTANHTNVNVPIYAIGAGTEVFKDAVVENIELAKFCAKIYSSEPFGQSEPIE